MENTNPEEAHPRIVLEKPETQSERQKRMMKFLRDKFGSSNPSLSLNLDDPKLTTLLSPLKTPTHPPYALMINRAISELNEKEGSSEKVISEFIKKTYENLPIAHEAILRYHLSNLCERRELICTDNGLYILMEDSTVESDVAVVMKPKKRKRVQQKGVGIRRPSKVKSRGREETNGEDIGKYDRPGREVEGVGEEEREDLAGRLEKGNETSKVEDQSKSEIQTERTSMKSDNGVQLNNTECNTGQDLDLGLNEAMLGEELQLEDVQKQSQQDTTELNQTMPAWPPTATELLPDRSCEGQQGVESTKPKKPSPVNQQKHDRSKIQWRKLRSHKKLDVESEMPIIISEPLLLSEFAELQVKGSSSLEVELQLNINQRRSRNELSLEHSPAQETLPMQISEVGNAATKVSAPLDSELRAQSEQQKVCGDKELSLPHQFPRRILRSHVKATSVSESPTPTLTLSSVLPEQPLKQITKPDANTAMVVWKPMKSNARGRPRKLETELSSNALSALLSPVKRRGRGRPRKVNTEENSIFESAMSLAGRPSTLNTELNSNVESVLSLALQPLTGVGRGRPRKLNTEAILALPVPPLKRVTRGRPRKLSTATNSNVETALALLLPPEKRAGRGRPRKQDTEKNSIAEAALALPWLPPKRARRGSLRKQDSEENSNAEAAMALPLPPTKRTGRGRLRKQVSEENSNAEAAPPLPSLLVKRDGQGRPPGELNTEANSNRNSNVEAPLSLATGRGRPRKPNTEENSNAEAPLALALGQAKRDGQGSPSKLNNTLGAITPARGLVGETNNKKQQPLADTAVSDPGGGGRVTRSRFQRSNAPSVALVGALR